MVNKCSEMSDLDTLNIVIILQKDHIMIGYMFVMSNYYLNFCFRVKEIST